MLRKVFYCCTLLLCSLVTTVQAEEAAVQEVTTSSQVVGYKNGFYIQSPDENYRLHITGYIQAWLQMLLADGTPDDNTFRIRRAYMFFMGNVYSKRLEYLILYAFNSATLLDMQINYSVTDNFRLKLGQYKIPFNYEALMSDSSYQLVDFSNIQTFFGVPRLAEPGLGIEGAFFNKHLEYRAGIFNGEGLGNSNSDNQYRLAGRVVANLLGRFNAKVVSDIHDSQSLNWFVGVGAMVNETTPPPTATSTPPERITRSLTAETGVQYRGFGSLVAGFFQEVDPAGTTAQQDYGLLAQAGYFLVPKTIELPVRIGLINAETANSQAEYTVGLNYFPYQTHDVKLQADYSFIVNEDSFGAGLDKNDHRVRLEAQVKF